MTRPLTLHGVLFTLKSNKVRCLCFICIWAHFRMQKSNDAGAQEGAKFNHDSSNRTVMLMEE